MTRLDELISQYYEETGEIPTEEVIRSFINEQNYEKEFRRPSYQQSYNDYYPSSGSASDGLFREVKDVFVSIARGAKESINDKRIFITKDSQLQEFNFMLLIFLCKAGLYFLLQNSYKKGYNFTNI